MTCDMCLRQCQKVSQAYFLPKAAFPGECAEHGSSGWLSDYLEKEKDDGAAFTRRSHYDNAWDSGRS